MKNDNVKIKNIFIGLILFFAWFGVASASTLYFLPESQESYSGETFIIDARIDTEGKSVNVINGTIEYPSDKIEVSDVVEGDSVISLWVQRPIDSDQKGEISFVGGAPNGFVGEGDIFKIVFKAKPGIISEEGIKFSGNTKVLLNDGKGTGDQLRFVPSSFKILKRPDDLPAITSNSHPDQNRWHRNNDIDLRWDIAQGAEYSFILSRDASIQVDETPDKPEGELVWMGDMRYKGLEDGIFYFHLRQKLPEKGWSEKTTFRAMIDSTRPEEFVPNISEIEGKKYLIFNARDTVSGIDHYEIKEKIKRGILDKFNGIDEGNFERAESPYLLKDQGLEGGIIIKAIDKAGNETLAEIHGEEKSMAWNGGMIVLIVFVIAIAVLALLILKKRIILFK